jgi:hypothetical protein
MQKTAAKPGQRTIWNKMREGIGWDSEEYEAANQKMRDADDHVRAIVTAQTNGTFDSENTKSLKDILKSARSNFNIKEYAKSIGDLAIFHKSMTDILNILNGFDNELSKEHRNFLLSTVNPNSPDYDPEYAKYIHDLRKRMEAANPPTEKKSYYNANLVKEAGIKDFMYRFTDRGRELAAWENRYPKRVKELKRKTLVMLDVSDKTLSIVFNALKEMSRHRSTRKIDDWYDAAKKIMTSANVYHQKFIEYYNLNIQQLLGSQEFLTAIKSEKETLNVDKQQEVLENTVKSPAEFIDPNIVMPNSDISPQVRGRIRPSITENLSDVSSVDPIVNVVEPVVSPTEQKSVEPINPIQQAPVEPAVKPVQQVLTEPVKPTVKPAEPAVKPAEPIVNPVEPTVKPVEPVVESTVKPAKPSVKPEQKPTGRPAVTPPTAAQMAMWKKKSHVKFIKSLESLSNEHPIVLAKYIVKYANSIKESDSETYNELVNIVKSIEV